MRFQRSRVQIRPPLRISGSESTHSGPKAFRDLIECLLSDGFPGQPRLTYTPTLATAPDTDWLCSPDMTHLTAELVDRRAARHRRRTRHRPHPPARRAPLRVLAHRRRRDSRRSVPRRQSTPRGAASGRSAHRRRAARPAPDLRSARCRPAGGGGPPSPSRRGHHPADAQTAIRSSEVVDLQLDCLDLIGRLITIRRGKGGRGRVIPIGQATTEALLVYLDERERHPLAHDPDLWLGHRGKRFGREGLTRSLRRRAQRAGVQGFRPHRLRHTAAHRWLAAGAPNPASWPSPDGPAVTCSFATPAPEPPSTPHG